MQRVHIQPDRPLFLQPLVIDQRCQFLRISRSHYGKMQKFSVFYGLRKTRIFLREFFKKVAIRNVAKKIAKLENIICDGVEFMRSIVF